MAGRRGLGRWAFKPTWLVVAGLMVAGVVCGLQLASAANRVRDDLASAKRMLGRASASGSTPLYQREELLRDAGRAIADAQTALHAWPLRQLGAAPLLGRDVRLASSVAAGAEATVTATRAATAALADLRAGRLSGGALIAAADSLQRLADVAAGSASRVRMTRPIVLDRQRLEFLDAAERAAGTARGLAQGVRLTARLYGSPRPARLFLAFQNPAELRGTGGLIGQYGILEGGPTGPQLTKVETYQALNRRAAAAALPMGRLLAYPDGVGDVPNVWSSVNLAPHLPEVGKRIVELYQRTVGPSLDGVVVLDPLAVAEMLKVSGPLSVAGTRIDASNVADLTLVQAYVRFADDRTARRRFLADVARQTFARLHRVLAQDPEGLVRALAAAARGRHIQIYAVNAGVQEALVELGVAGSAAAPAHGDYLLPVGVNTAANKLDAFLERELRYEVHLGPDGSARTSVGIRLRNTVQLGRLPRYVVGPYDHRFRAGEHRLYQTVYLAGEYEFSRATLDHRPVAAAAGADVGALTLSQQVRIPVGRTVRLGYDLERSDAARRLGRGMRYELLLRPQATMRPDSLQVSVHAPDGWRFVSVPEGTRNDRSRARWTGLLEREWTMVFILARQSN